MANVKHSATHVDLTVLAYKVAHALELLEFSYSDVTRATGVSRRQLSDLSKGIPISAGATFMVMQLCRIPWEEVLPPECVLKLIRIREIQQEQTVTLPVSRETSSSIALEEGLKSGRIVKLDEARSG